MKIALAAAVAGVLILLWFTTKQQCACDHFCGPVCCRAPRAKKCLCGAEGDHICTFGETKTLPPQQLPRRSCALLYNNERGDPRSDMECVPMDVSKQ